MSSTITVLLIELGAITLACVVCYVLATRLAHVVPGLRSTDRPPIVRGVRRSVLAAWVALALLVLAYNGWLVWRGIPPREHTLEVLRSLGPDTFLALGIAVAKLAVAAIAVVLLARGARQLLQRAEDAINRWDKVKDNDQSLGRFFAGLGGALEWTAWLLWLVLASQLLGLPGPVTHWLWVAVRVSVIVAAGLALVRSMGVIVETLDGVSHRFASDRDWLRYYDHLRPLVPTFRAGLEYVVWIAMAALVLAQFETLRDFSAWGPRLIEAIGIFLVGRAVIELGHLEIGHRLLPKAGLTDAERLRRSTVVPLLRSVFTYGTYFAVAVLILAAIGFNPMPFLAGAGILGLVIGFGAQSLINDVVSGFFILFENVYLVGDTIETGNARGIVQAIEFRTTKIRDDDGRLHIIRNADVGRVINHSREYSLAIVTLDVGYDAEMNAVFRTMREAGAQAREAHPADVLADLEIGGITRFGEKSLTVRATMRVRPGRSEAIAAALRLAIKEGFDRAAGDAPRKSLLPASAGPGGPTAFSTAAAPIVSQDSGSSGG
jgi:small conductance mechanosensitive channel